MRTSTRGRRPVRVARRAASPSAVAVNSGMNLHPRVILKCLLDLPDVVLRVRGRPGSRRVPGAEAVPGLARPVAAPAPAASPIAVIAARRAIEVEVEGGR